MANYLYNGVELPALPEWDRETYPYAWIYKLTKTTADTTSEAIHFCAFGSEAYYTYIEDSGDLWFGGVANSDYSTKQVAGLGSILSDGAWEELYSYDDYVVLVPDGTPTNLWGTTITRTLVWSNFDVEYDGTLYLAASDPVPVTPHDPTALFMGWLAGKRMAAMRGKQTDEPSGVYDTYSVTYTGQTVDPGAGFGVAQVSDMNIEESGMGAIRNSLEPTQVVYNGVTYEKAMLEQDGDSLAYFGNPYYIGLLFGASLEDNGIGFCFAYLGVEGVLLTKEAEYAVLSYSITGKREEYTFAHSLSFEPTNKTMTGGTSGQKYGRALFSEPIPASANYDACSVVFDGNEYVGAARTFSYTMTSIDGSPMYYADCFGSFAAISHSSTDEVIDENFPLFVELRYADENRTESIGGAVGIPDSTAATHSVEITLTRWTEA